MQIVYHLGAHCTDEGRLVHSLGRDRELLAAAGTVIPDPRRYRDVFQKLLPVLGKGPASPDMQEMFLDAILDEDGAQRVVLSNPSFLGSPSQLFGKSGIAPTLAQRMRELADLAPGAGTEFFLGLRNPATLIPALLTEVSSLTYDDLVGDCRMDDLTWRPAIEAARMACPDLGLTVWLNEDSPLLWPQLLRALGGFRPEINPVGGLDLLGQLVTREGMKQLQAAIDGTGTAAHSPVEPNVALERLKAALGGGVLRGPAPKETKDTSLSRYAEILSQHARPGAMEMEVSVPGWSGEHVAAITARYEADAAVIAAMEGVTFLRQE